MDLLKGVAVVIDDELYNQSSDINRIIEKIKEKGIPVVSYDSLESAEKCISNFAFVSFIILDWKMISPIETDTAEIVSAGTCVGVDENRRKVIEFINKVKDVCFTPIFIFTNRPQEDINNEILPALKQAHLFYDDERRNFIFVQNKNYMLKGNRLLSTAVKWIENTPSVYVLKVWDKELLKVKNKVFWDLYNISKGIWPKVLWAHFEKEKENPSLCLNETISTLIIGTMSLDEIDKKKIMKRFAPPDMKEIKKIFRRTMYDEGDLHGIKPGDIYKDNDDYYINIRPECDTARGSANVRIYLLKGQRVQSDKLKQLRRQYSGNGLTPKINETFVSLLEGDGIVKFDFRKLTIEKYSGFKDKRQCRLLPPFITNIQQRYAAFIGRFGVPRLPQNVEKELLKPQGAEEVIAQEIPQQ